MALIQKKMRFNSEILNIQIMFYYTTNKRSRLEVSIIENYSPEDILRIVHFIDALLKKPTVEVVFNVHPSMKNIVEKTILKNNRQPNYGYNINELVA